jgi:hypothetical protein
MLVGQTIPVAVAVADADSVIHANDRHVGDAEWDMELVGARRRTDVSFAK